MNLNDRPYFPNGIPHSEILRIQAKAINRPRSLLDWEVRALENRYRRRRAAGNEAQPGHHPAVTPP